MTAFLLVIVLMTKENLNHGVHLAKIWITVSSVLTHGVHCVVCI